MQLRDYQTEGLEAIRFAFRYETDRVLYVGPTGMGKTVLFSAIADGAYRKANRIYVLVDRQKLIMQTSRMLTEFGIRHGIIWSKHPMQNELVQVCSVQTLIKRLDRVPKPHLVIVDEAHMTPAATHRRIIEALAPRYLLGVTATPWRGDGTGLGHDYGKMIVGPSVGKLIEDGYLCPFKAFIPPRLYDLSGVSINSSTRDYVTGELVAEIDRPVVTGNVVETYKTIDEGRAYGLPGFAFCASIEHAQHVAEQFNRAGIPAASLDGTMDDTEREQLFNDFATGKLWVLTAADLLSVGVDIPCVAVGMLLTPTESLTKALQQMGRVLRLYPGKTWAYLIDHAGNILKHGMPDMEREWSMLDRQKRKKGESAASVAVRQCPKCYAAFSPRPICPECQHEFVVESRVIEQVEGDLVEVTKDMAKTIEEDQKAKAKKLAQLINIGIKRGYKYPAEWAKLKMQAKKEA